MPVLSPFTGEFAVFEMASEGREHGEHYNTHSTRKALETGKTCIFW
jgi:hypothetical protein